MSGVRFAVAALLVFLFAGCSARDKSYLRVTDSEYTWAGTGFTVKAPSDEGWYLAPSDDNFPNAIVFFNQEGKVFRVKGNYWYLNGTQVVAAGTLLDEPVSDRKDKGRLAEALQAHLMRHPYFWDETITKASYEQLSGLDCVSYWATPVQEMLSTPRGTLHQGDSRGYICLHSDLNTFGVIMKSRDVATVGTNTTSKTRQTDHFFKSLRFTPISSSALNAIPKNKGPVTRWLP